MAFLKRLWAAAPIATTVLAIALAVSGFFAVRMVAFWFYWNDPAHREQEIAAWMTPGFVANSWHVPREVVLQAVNAPQPPPDGPMSLADLAALNGVPVETLIAAAQQSIDEFRLQQAHPQPRPPEPPEGRP